MHISATDVLVFFGVLAAALVLGAALIVRAVLRAAAIKRLGYVLEPGPGDIQDALQAVPVMQQARARKAYLGLGVRWHVTFDSVIVLSPFRVRVMCEGRGNAAWIFGDVHLRDYPQLNGLLRNAPFWISGHISKITVAEIYLKNVRLEFEE